MSWMKRKKRLWLRSKANVGGVAVPAIPGLSARPMARPEVVCNEEIQQSEALGRRTEVGVGPRTSGRSGPVGAIAALEAEVLHPLLVVIKEDPAVGANGTPRPECIR